jgi:hypothetical protein
MPFDGVAPAVVNAIRSLGIDLREVPATPERVMAAPRIGIRDAGLGVRPFGRLRAAPSKVEGRDSGHGRRGGGRGFSLDRPATRKRR